MPQGNPNNGPGTTATARTGQTVHQVFTSRHLWEWWLQNGGNGTNPFNGVSEKGIDYSTTWGTPVAVPVGGRIVRKESFPNSMHDIVELQAIDGAVWLYMHIAAKVKVGDTLSCGDVIGTEDGLPRDQHSTGPHIEVRYCPPGKWGKAIGSWQEPWINPIHVFSTIGNQVAGTTSGGIFNSGPGGSPGSTGLPGILSKVPVHIGPTDSVPVVLSVLDQAMVITNPFDVQPMPTFSVAGADIPDPIGYVQDVTNNLANDLSAIAMRFFLFAIGGFIIFKVVSTFIDFDAVFSTAKSGAKTVAAATAL